MKKRGTDGEAVGEDTVAFKPTQQLSLLKWERSCVENYDAVSVGEWKVGSIGAARVHREIGDVNTVWAFLY